VSHCCATHGRYRCGQRWAKSGRSGPTEAAGSGRDLKRSSAGAHVRAAAAPGAGAGDAYSKRACSGWTIGAGPSVGGGELALPASFVAWSDVAGIDSPGASAQTAASMPT
jgi:hypothetical protein